jgi:intraflagellar transport protein 80
MAINSRHLDTAEIALAAINEVAKLHYILYIKDIPSEEGRNAELAVYKRHFDEAEQILLQATPPLIYRAIKLNIRLYRWARALQIAVENKTHVDTVLGYREV